MIPLKQKKSENNVALNYKDHRGNRKPQSFVEMPANNFNTASIRQGTLIDKAFSINISKCTIFKSAKRTAKYTRRHYREAFEEALKEEGK